VNQILSKCLALMVVVDPQNLSSGLYLLLDSGQQSLKNLETSAFVNGLSFQGPFSNLNSLVFSESFHLTSNSYLRCVTAAPLQAKHRWYEDLVLLWDQLRAIFQISLPSGDGLCYYAKWRLNSG
jgi:hypothetical protein